jgi:hypothetical protein
VLYSNIIFQASVLRFYKSELSFIYVFGWRVVFLQKWLEKSAPQVARKLSFKKKKYKENGVLSDVGGLSRVNLSTINFRFPAIGGGFGLLR